jgi:hypothetical protein
MPSDVTVRCGCGFYLKVTGLNYDDKAIQVVTVAARHPDHTSDPPAAGTAEEHDLTASGTDLERAAVAVGFVQPVSGGSS